MKYEVIAHGVEVDLRSFSLVRAPFDGLSYEDVSSNSIFSHHFLLHIFCVPTSNPMYCHRSYGVLGPMHLLL